MKQDNRIFRYKNVYGSVCRTLGNFVAGARGQLLNFNYWTKGRFERDPKTI
jgi:hypothetical protein